MVAENLSWPKPTTAPGVVPQPPVPPENRLFGWDNITPIGNVCRDCRGLKPYDSMGWVDRWMNRKRMCRCDG